MKRKSKYGYINEIYDILLAFVLFQAIFYVLYFKMGRLRLVHISSDCNRTRTHVCMSDCILNTSFWTPVPWYLHLNFCSKMIKRNLEWHNWGRISIRSVCGAHNVFGTLWQCLFWPILLWVFLIEKLKKSLLWVALNLARNETWVVPETYTLCDGVLLCF